MELGTKGSGVVEEVAMVSLKDLAPWFCLKDLVPWFRLKDLVPWLCLKDLVPWFGLKDLASGHHYNPSTIGMVCLFKG